MGSEWILGRLAWGGCGFDSAGSGQGLVVGCCECGDEPSGSCATELVSWWKENFWTNHYQRIWTGFMWVKREPSCRLLQTQY
jgi:hypothetical protein